MDDDLIKEVRDGLAGIRTDQQGNADKQSDLEKRFLESQERTEAAKLQAEERHTSTEEWLRKIELRFESQRFGAGDTGDGLKQVIPDEYKGMAPRLDGDPKYGKTTEDVWKSVGKAAWLKMAAKLQLKRYSADHARIAEDLRKLEKVLNFGVPTTKDLEEGVGAEGGFTVPVPIEAEILRALSDEGVVRRLARTVTMTSLTLDLPFGDGAVTANLIDEEASITQVDETFKQRKLTARKFASFGRASWELIQDAVSPGILDHFQSIAVEKIALLEDDQALEGDGTGINFTGVKIATDVNAVTATTKALWATSLANGKMAGPRQSRRNASWIMHSTNLAGMLGAADANGTPILNRSDISRILGDQLNVGLGLGEGTIMGNPVFTSDEIAINATPAPDEGTVYYGNWAEGMVFGDRTGIDFAMSEHTNFQTAQITMRIIKRTGIVVAIPTYLTRITAFDIT